MRKKRDERLNEILDAAEQLFTQKGYEHATVNDILEQVQIGKGTFYHYFKSKEEVMNAIIARITKYVVNTAKTITEDTALQAHEKMQRILLSLNIPNTPNGPMIEELHQPSNAQMHQNSIVATVKAVAPILAQVVMQGVEEGVYNTPYPQETIEIILAANQSIFDEGFFHWEPDELKTRVIAFVRIIELALGADEGSFHFVYDLFAIGNGQECLDERNNV